LTLLDESQAANSFLPTARDGANARVQRINCEGGLGTVGAKVEMEYCVTNLDANTTTACANKAIDDTSYVAVAGSQSSAADTAPLYATAGVPNIPGAAFLPGDFAGATTFNTSSGVLVVGGIGSVACTQNFKSLKELRNQLDASAQATALINLALQSYGCDALKQSYDIAPGAADVSPQVTSAAEGVDAVTLDLLPSSTQQVFKARKQLGITTPFVAATAEFTNETLKSMGDAADGSLIAGWFPTDDVKSAGNDAFLADLAAIGKADSSGDVARAAWVALDLLAAATKSAATVDRASVLEGLQALSSYDAGGMTPKLDFTKDGADPRFPRIFNPTVAQATIKDGKLIALPGAEPFLPVFKG
jgi:branched-chain amino acid transport system substrate-binding protein